MMKNKFIRHFAVRNIQANKKSSFVIILTLSLVFTLLIMLFSMTSVLNSVFTGEAKNQYPNVDVIVSYDEYSLSRLVNKRYITENYAQDTNYVLSFFNVDVLTKYGGKVFYSKLYSAVPNEFEILTNRDVSISGKEAVITASFAKSRKLKQGDSLDFDVLDKTLTYTIKEIIPDNGVFSGDAIFVDKSVLFNELYGIDYLKNLGNMLYIKLNSNVDINDFISMLKADPNYDNYDIYPTVDKQYIADHAVEVSSMYLGLGLIIVIAIFLVVGSLFPVITRDIKKELGVVTTLGGERKFIWKVYLLQWLWLILVAFGVALIFTLIIINIGAYVYGVRGIVFYNILSLIISLGAVCLFIFIGSWISYKKMTDLSVIAQTKDKRYETIKINYWFFIASTVLLLVILLTNPFSLAINSLIITISSIYSAMIFLSILIKFVTSLINKMKGKKSVYRLFQNKYLNNNRHIHQSVRVLFVSLVVIVMVFSIRSFLNSEVALFNQEMQFDLALININDYNASLNSDVKNVDGITNAEPAAFYTNIMVNFNEKDSELIKFFVSMDRNQMENYFNFSPSTVEQKYITGSLPYVILPKNFEMVYGIKKGDIINLDLNYKLQNISVVVGGFFNTNFDNVVYSNIYQKVDYLNEVKVNSIFIKSNDTKTVFNVLVQKYSLNMYYVFDVNSYFGDYISLMEKISDFFMILTGFMIVCFLVVVFNNTLLMFFDLKSDLAKIKVLGVDVKQFVTNLMIEFVIISGIIFIVGIVEISILSRYLKNVVILLNFYKNISAGFLDIIYGFTLTFIMLLLSYVYYLKKIGTIKIIDEMKFY